MASGGIIYYGVCFFTYCVVFPVVSTLLFTYWCFLVLWTLFVVFLLPCVSFRFILVATSGMIKWNCWAIIFQQDFLPLSTSGKETGPSYNKEIRKYSVSQWRNHKGMLVSLTFLNTYFIPDFLRDSHYHYWTLWRALCTSYPISSYPHLCYSLKQFFVVKYEDLSQRTDRCFYIKP